MHNNFIVVYLYLMLKKISHNIQNDCKIENWPKNVVIL